MKLDRSISAFKEAQQYIPGGVNSPARAFLAVEEAPRFIKEAHGQFIEDIDGNKYLDYIGSWGPMILGNDSSIVKDAIKRVLDRGLSYGAATEGEVYMAKLMCQMIPSFEKVRMVTSGTEATMSAIRAARGYTKREKILKFIGCYHGHHDALLVKSGSGLLLDRESEPDSAGVTRGTVKDTLLVEYNDIEGVKKIFEDNPKEIAAVIVEPVAANMGVVLPKKGFLEELRKLCTENGTVLIFDEVITGFRLSLGGAQKLFGITPDMATFGKIIGAGLPVGAYGGKKEIMDCVAPVGKVYQAGTLAGNPVAIAAGIAQLEYLLENEQDVYGHINNMGNMLFEGIKEILCKNNIDYRVNYIGSIGSLFFTGEEVVNFNSAMTSDKDEFSRYFSHLINNGIYAAPSQFEALFISKAHREEDIEYTLKVVREFFEG